MAPQYYLRAFSYSNKYLGADHKLSILCKDSWSDSKDKLQKYKSKQLQEHEVNLNN